MFWVLGGEAAQGGLGLPEEGVGFGGLGLGVWDLTTRARGIRAIPCFRKPSRSPQETASGGVKALPKSSGRSTSGRSPEHRKWPVQVSFKGSVKVPYGSFRRVGVPYFGGPYSSDPTI